MPEAPGPCSSPGSGSLCHSPLCPLEGERRCRIAQSAVRPACQPVCQRKGQPRHDDFSLPRRKMLSDLSTQHLLRVRPAVTQLWKGGETGEDGSQRLQRPPWKSSSQLPMPRRNKSNIGKHYANEYWFLSGYIKRINMITKNNLKNIRKKTKSALIIAPRGNYCECTFPSSLSFKHACQEDTLLRARQPAPVFLPENPHGQRRLEGYSPWGCTESDTTEGT